MSVQLKDQVLHQQEIGQMACGPCSIVHSLSKKSEDVVSLILKCIETPSKKYEGKQMMYTGKGGMTSDDIVTVVKDLYDIQMKATFLNRTGDPKSNAKKIKGEQGCKFVKRIHTLLKDALTKSHLPIVEIRSFVCEPQKWTYEWFCTMGHFHTIIEVQDQLMENSLGFTYKFKESLTGEIMDGYLYFNPYGEGYAATRDFTVDINGKEIWQWLDDFPYLEVVAPIHLETDRCPYQARVVTVLKTLIS